MPYIKINENIHLITDNLTRKMVKAEIVFTTGGSWFEEEKDRGRMHLLEHCIASRTKTMPYQEFKDFQFENGIDLNAYTGPLTMGLTASGHYTDSKKILDILIEIAFEPTFDEDILSREKEVVLREITERRGESNYQLHYDTMKDIYKENTYETHEVLGSPKQVELSEITDFYRLHKKMVDNSQMLIILNGSGFDEKIIEDLKSKLNDKKINSAGTGVCYSFPNEMQDFKQKNIFHKFAHKEVDLQIFLPFKSTAENLAAKKIFAELFLRYNGVLYDTLRDKEKLVYAVYFYFNIDAKTLQIQVSCEFKKVQKVIDFTKKVFSDFDTYFNADRFEKFRSILYKQLDISMDTLGKSTSFTEQSVCSYGKFLDLDTFKDNLLAVTKDDIQNIYKTIQDSIPDWKYVLISSSKKIKELKNIY